MSTLPPDDTLFAELSPMLDEAQSLSARLDELSRRQSSFIDDGDPERLLQVLEERQAVLDRLTPLSRAIEPLLARLDESPLATRAQRESARHRAAQVAETAAWVQHRDRADADKLQLRRDELSAQLTELSASRSATNAYGGPRNAPPPRFQDRQA